MRVVFVLFLLFSLFFSCTKIPDEFYQEPSYISQAASKEKAYYKSYNESMKLWDISYEELYIPTTYGIAHVTISGSSFNEPLVLLHGMDASSTMWYPNAKALSGNYQLFAIDLLTEPGKSKKKHELESVDHLMQWYEEIFNKLKLKKFHLVGASRGGWIATNLATKNPQSIRSLTLLSPAQTFIWIRPSQDLITNVVNAFSSDRKRQLRSLSTMTVNINNIHNTYLNQFFLGKELEIDNMFVASMTPFSRKKLEQLSMPVLLLIGDQDIINNKKSIVYGKSSIKKFQGEIIPNSGHFLSIDQANLVNKKMLAFLKQQ